MSSVITWHRILLDLVMHGEKIIGGGFSCFHTHTHTNTHKHTLTRTNTSPLTHKHTHVHPHTHKHARTHIHPHTRRLTPTHIHALTPKHTPRHAHAHTHPHTYAHIFLLTPIHARTHHARSLTLPSHLVCAYNRQTEDISDPITPSPVHTWPHPSPNPKPQKKKNKSSNCLQDTYSCRNFVTFKVVIILTETDLCKLNTEPGTHYG